MRVQIATRHCEVPEKVRTRTIEQVERLNRYEPRVSAAEVVYTQEKLSRQIEVILHIDGEAPVVAKGDGKEFRSALDKAVERLGRMLKKQRARRVDHQGPKLSEASVVE